MAGKRTLREHRTAAKAWDASRAAATSTRAPEAGWSDWAKRKASHARRQLAAQKAAKKGRRR